MVRLAHFSVKEYLVSNRIRTGSAPFFSIDERTSNAVIGETSLSCLQLYDEASFANSEEFSKEFPLARYAAEYWNNHLPKNNGIVHPMAIQLFLGRGKLRNWIALFDMDFVDPRRIRVPKSAGSQLYYAVLTGLKDLVEALINIQEGQSREGGPANGNNTAQSDTDVDLAALQITNRNAYVNATGGALHTPLQAASWLGRLDIVELLIKHGADPNIYGGCEGGSALSAAAHNRHLIIMELLLDTSADIHEGLSLETSDNSEEGDMGSGGAKDLFKPEFGEIHQDIDQEWKTLSQRRKQVAKDMKGFKDVINPPVDMLDRRAIEQCRQTALFKAAELGNVEIVSFMLDHGAMVDLRNGESGRTALAEASWNNDIEIVKLLLEKGASVDKTDIRGQTALVRACRHGPEDIARVLLDKGAHDFYTGRYRGKCMMYAIETENDKIVKLLLEKGADVNMGSELAGRPLRAATVIGYEPTVRLLAEQGADLNEESPLIEALKRGHIDIARLLVAKKADVNAVQGFGLKDSIPFWAYSIPTTRCLTQMMLSSNGVSRLCLRPKKRNQCERKKCIWEDSPLWVAAALGEAESTKLLLDHGADPNKPGPCALTPTHIATLEEHEEVVQLLLAAGGDTHLKVENLNDVDVESYVEINRSSCPLTVSGFVGAGGQTLNLLEILSRAKSNAKANGDVRFGQLSAMAKYWMRDPRSGYFNSMG